MFDAGKQPQSINFLEPVYSPTDLWANAYIWLVNVGKYLLLGVEILVLAVFVSRFFLDRSNNDLTEDVNNKVALLSNENWKKNSVLYENYQTLFGDIKKIREKQSINSTTVSELINGIPSSLILETFSYSSTNVSFHLKATSLDAVKNYESALKNNPNYYDVKFSINKDNSEVNVRVTFSLVEKEE